MKDLIVRSNIPFVLQNNIWYVVYCNNKYIPYPLVNGNLIIKETIKSEMFVSIEYEY